MIDLLTIAPRAAHIFFPNADIFCSSAVVESIKNAVRQPEFVEYAAQHFLYLAVAGVTENERRRGEYIITVNCGLNQHQQLQVRTTMDKQGVTREVILTFPGETI